MQKRRTSSQSLQARSKRQRTDDTGSQKRVRDAARPRRDRRSDAEDSQDDDNEQALPKDAEDGETEASDSAAAIDIKSDEDNQEKILVLNNISRKTVSLS
mgnify:CR=1 FL=1